MTSIFPSEEWLEALREHLDARGWDREMGYPSKEKLESLDLGWVATELWPEN